MLKLWSFLAVLGLFLLVACGQTEVPSGAAECVTDADCVKASCCHADSCVPVGQAPDCSDVFCTQDCQPGTLDCGQGSCLCQNGKCAAVFE